MVQSSTKRLGEDAKMYEMKPSPVNSGNVIVSGIQPAAHN